MDDEALFKEALRIIVGPNRTVATCWDCGLYQMIDLVEGKPAPGQDCCPECGNQWSPFKEEDKEMKEIKEFFSYETRKVDAGGYIVHYPVSEGASFFPTHAVVEDSDGKQEMVDVAEVDYQDFDDFISAVIEKYEGR